MSARGPKAPRWDRPEELDQSLVIVCADARRTEALREHLARLPGGASAFTCSGAARASSSRWIAGA